MVQASAEAGYWLQQGLNGLFLATLYAVLATAYALLQGITNRIILSFGDIATFGAFAAVSVVIWSLVQGRDGLVALLPALIAAALATAALGRVTYGSIFAPLVAGPGQAVMIASIGLSILLQELLRIHSNARDQWLPPLFGDSLTLVETSYSVRIGFTQLVTALVAWMFLALLHVGMARSHAGRLWRAVSQNNRLAMLCGVDTHRVFAWTFVVASAFAGLAGALVTVSYGGVNFAMGLVLGFKAMFAAIIGGFGTLSGAVAGAIFLAGLEVMWTAIFPAAYRDVAVFGIIILVLILKPEGLLGHALVREDA